MFIFFNSASDFSLLCKYLSWSVLKSMLVTRTILVCFANISLGVRHGITRFIAGRWQNHLNMNEYTNHPTLNWQFLCRTLQELNSRLSTRYKPDTTHGTGLFVLIIKGLRINPKFNLNSLDINVIERSDYSIFIT